jgi:hypothetical protein
MPNDGAWPVRERNLSEAAAPQCAAGTQGPTPRNLAENTLSLNASPAHAGGVAFITVPELPAADLVALLADPHRSSAAYARLRQLGPHAAQAARDGLRHHDARVREHCCIILDHVLDDASIGPLIQALDDPVARVRMQAVHALACDRCKKDACRPAPAAVLPRAIALLAGDPSALVRAYAAELVGRFAHSHPAAREAVSSAAAHDPSPAVRKKASWHAPGGPIYQRHRS